MSSDSNTIAAGGARIAAMHSSTPAPEVFKKPSSGVQVPAVPKVHAPKPVAIIFDPNEARQSIK